MKYKYKDIIYQKEGAIARIIFNRPERLNAFDFPTDKGICYEVIKALEDTEWDDDVKVVILKGAGRSFCAGHDLTRVYHVYEEADKKSGERRPSERARLNIDRTWYRDLYIRLLAHPKIIIAQVHGHCIGEGIGIMEHCDIAIAAENAHLSHAEQRLGFAGSGGPRVTLYQTIGHKRALWMLLSGDAIDGREAERIGLVTKAVPLAKLEEETERIARQMCLLPKDGIAIGKAAHHWICDILGLTKEWTLGYITHTFFTNLRWEPGEFNFIKQRKEKGAKAGFHERDQRYKDIK